MNTRLTTAVFGRRCRLAVLAMVLLCSYGTTVAQGFEKTFGGPKEDFGSAILQTKDHGYLEVGSSEGKIGDNNDFDIFVVRTDVDGIRLWERTYDEGFVEQATDVVETFDGAYFIVGYRQETPTSPEQTYLLKVSRRGELLFSRSFGNGLEDERANQILRLVGGDYFITGYRVDEVSGHRDVLLTRINANGDVIWRSAYGGIRDDAGIGAVPTPDGGFIIGANVKRVIGTDNDIALQKVDANGQLQWSKTYGSTTEDERITDIIPTQDGQLAFAGFTDDANKALVAKADLNGDTLWFREFDQSPFEDGFNALIEEDEGENLVAVGQTIPTPDNLDVLMVKLRSADGQDIWRRSLGDSKTLDVAEGVAPTVDGGYALAAFSTRSVILFSDMSLFKTNNFGEHQTNYLQGRVYYPGGNDCGAYQDGDLGLAGWLVKAESEAATFFGSTDSLGRYELRVDKGFYTVSLLERNDRWTLCNPDPLTVDFSADYDSSFQDFPLRPDVDCPLLEITLNATPAISCSNQEFTVSYGNQGSVVATDVKVEVELDEVLGFLNADRLPTETNGNRLTFTIGELLPGEQGSFGFLAEVACASVREGQAISSRARITPVYRCSEPDPQWDGSSIVVTSKCDPGSGPTFTITNVGVNPMRNSNDYIIIEDVVFLESGNFELLPNESKDVLIAPRDGSTYRIIAEQSTGHPGSRFPTAVEEGCVRDANGNFTTGRVAQFPDNDGDLHLDILTQEIVVLEDGANLQMAAYPRGYQDSIIFPKTDIEYTVFFAPPANENFERVVVRDTLSKLLDFNSLEMGAASHPYDFVLYQDGVLKITFDSIRIFSGGSAGEADAASGKGYVSFRLSQKPNNLPGAVIRNRAAVYFDYQTPVVSREIRQTVGCEDLFKGDCLQTTSTRNFPTVPGVNIKVSPNPLSERTTVRIAGWDRPEELLEFRLFDAAGRQVRRREFRGNQLEVLREKLTSGAYFYEVSGTGFLLGSGRLIIK